MNKIFRIPSMFLAASVLMLAGCVNEKDDPKEGNLPEGKGETVSFTIGGASEFTTKSGLSERSAVAEQFDKIALEAEGGESCNDQLFLIATVESLDDIYSLEKPGTKGIPIYTENFTAHNSTFNAYAYQYTSSANSVFDSAAQFDLANEDTRTYEYQLVKTWPANNNLMFFLSAPTDLAAAGATVTKREISGDNGITTFSYSAPEGSESNSTLLQDIMFTSKPFSWANHEAGKDLESPALFYHGLAGVKFKSANAEYEDSADKGTITTTIVSVEMTNIISSGTCVVTPDQSYDGSDSNKNGSYKSKDATSWTLTKTDLRTYTLSNPGITNPTDATENFASSFYGGDKKLGDYNVNSTNYANTFFFVPQVTGTDSGEDVILTIKYKLSNTGDTVYERKATFNGQNWLAGNLYTYTLSANHVDVAITDNVALNNNTKAQEKTNLTITNTGNTPSLIRVAVIGNWYDTHSPEQITGVWNIDSDNQPSVGDFDDTFADTDYWYRGNDGFYYYIYKVKPGDTVKHPLFEKYSLSDTEKDTVTDSHLEIDILVQAVDANRVFSTGEAQLDGWDFSTGTPLNVFDK